MLHSMIDKKRKQYYIRGKKWVSIFMKSFRYPDWSVAGR